MVFQALESWGTVIDGIQIFLIFVVLILFFRYRNLGKQKVLNSIKTADAPSFNAEIFAQTMQQQLEQAFINIIASVRVEISHLERLLQTSQMQVEKPSENDLQPWTRFDSAACPDRHKHIEMLAGKGMSIQRISEELKIPQAEIELILSLKAARA
jgi:hypothetical protein